MIERPLLRWLGGKYRLARQIIACFPPHRQYVEPYCGAASVLFQKPPAYNELINDLDGELVNLFQVLRSSDGPGLVQQLRLTPYAAAEYELALQLCDDPVERARRMIVRSHMAHGTGSARMDRRPGFRSNGTSGTTNVAGEWASFPDALEHIIERLRPVVIQSRPALELIRLYDDPKVLIYLDPPYMPETRSTKAKQSEGYHTYAVEMTEADHAEMLETILASRSMVCLSGYPSTLYAQALSEWECRMFDSRAHNNAPRQECLWINPVALARTPGLLAGMS
jgi:DNA adenine methylase